MHFGELMVLVRVTQTYHNTYRNRDRIDLQHEGGLAYGLNNTSINVGTTLQINGGKEKSRPLGSI